MKKILLFCVALMATTLVNAQETDAAATNSPTILYRVSEMYYYGETAMDKKAYSLFLQQNCPAAYRQFSQGRNTSIAGWVLLSAGLGLSVSAGITYYAAAKKSKTSPMSTSSASRYGTTISALSWAGTALELACIPTLIVGYSKMHNSVNTFNVACASKMTAKPYWSINASENGLGMAYNF